MSKLDGQIEAAGTGSIALDELLVALGQPPRRGADRQDAMAQFLSGEEGWRDAGKALRGTFADPPPGATGLTGDKEL